MSLRPNNLMHRSRPYIAAILLAAAALLAESWLAMPDAAASVLLGKSPPDAGSASAGPDDLPLVELPAATPAGEYLAVVVSGDGGWANIDREIAGELATRGIPVIGWDSLQYFWTRRTPDGVGQDLARVLDTHLQTSHTRRVLLIGYSLGADVLPFMASRLPPELKDRIALVALLGISPSMDFEFRVSDWLPGNRRPAPYPTAPEVAKLMPLKTLCVYGEKEDDSLCPQLKDNSVMVKKLPGGHHFDGDYQRLTRIILDAAR